MSNAMTRTECARLEPEDLRARIPTPEGKRFFVGLERGELVVEFYVPHREDRQTPHSRDECYVVVEGEGQFRMGDTIVPFKPGDFLFVPAGVEHRFLDFGETMAAWVIFYGPEGGDMP